MASTETGLVCKVRVRSDGQPQRHLPGVRGGVVRHRKRSRLRRATKWMGLFGCALLVEVWILSLFWCFGNVGPTGIRYVVQGHAYITYHPPGSQTGLGWSFRRSDFGCVWWPSHRVDMGRLARWWIPLWMPLLVIALPTAWFWKRDRRPPPGHCTGCSYDLTGNESGVCPECGAPIEKDSPSGTP